MKKQNPILENSSTICNQYFAPPIDGMKGPEMSTNILLAGALALVTVVFAIALQFALSNMHASQALTSPLTS